MPAFVRSKQVKFHRSTATHCRVQNNNRGRRIVYQNFNDKVQIFSLIDIEALVNLAGKAFYAGKNFAGVFLGVLTE